MFVEKSKPFQQGEICVGLSSWNPFERSIRYQYRCKSGRISRGSPEVSMETLAQMVTFAIEQNYLTDEQKLSIKTILK